MSFAASVDGIRRQPGRFGRLWRTLKQIFHEVIAAIFAVLSFSWFNAAVRAYSRDAAYWLIAVAGIVAASFLFFAFTSFRRARSS
jgi:hypothetical protein